MDHRPFGLSLVMRIKLAFPHYTYTTALVLVKWPRGWEGGVAVAVVATNATDPGNPARRDRRHRDFIEEGTLGHIKISTSINRPRHRRRRRRRRRQHHHQTPNPTQAEPPPLVLCKCAAVERRKAGLLHSRAISSSYLPAPRRCQVVTKVRACRRTQLQ